MYSDNEILFPHHSIPALAAVRGERWRALVEHVGGLPELHEDVLAFMLMMMRLNGCLSCETDSFRAMRGCTACSVQTLRRFKGSDDELIERYHSAQDEIRRYAAAHPGHIILGADDTHPTTSNPIAGR